MNESRNIVNPSTIDLLLVRSDLERLTMAGGHCIVNVDFEDDQILVMLIHYLVNLNPSSSDSSVLTEVSLP